MDILVTTDGLTLPSGEVVRCAIGRGGINIHKQEGDGVSPVGDWEMRHILYRSDKMTAPISGLSTFSITNDDGWCDAPADPNYNKAVKLPYNASHEIMWRDDNLYDVVVVLGHNDNPPVTDQGSAIFLHVAKIDYGPTEGCIALPIETLLDILKDCKTGDRLSIRP